MGEGVGVRADRVALLQVSAEDGGQVAEPHVPASETRSPPASGISKSISRSRSRSGSCRSVVAPGRRAGSRRRPPKRRRARSRSSSTGQRTSCSSMWSSSSVRRSGASGSACSRTACTSDPNVAPTGRSAIGDTTASLGTAAAAAAPARPPRRPWPRPRARWPRRPRVRATASTALSEEYDARRQVRSTDRVNGRADSGGTSARSGSAPGSGWTAGSATDRPRCATCRGTRPPRRR